MQKRMHKKLTYENCIFKEMDGENMTYEDDYFDFAIE